MYVQYYAECCIHNRNKLYTLYTLRCLLRSTKIATISFLANKAGLLLFSNTIVKGELKRKFLYKRDSTYPISHL